MAEGSRLYKVCFCFCIDSTPPATFPTQAGLYIDFKTEFNVASCLAPAKAPILSRDFSEQDLYMITGNAKALQVLYDGSVQLPFGVKGSTREGVTTNVGVQFRLCPRRRTCKTMRFVDHQSDVSISRKNPKSLS